MATQRQRQAARRNIKIDGIAAGLADLLENREGADGELRRHAEELRASIKLEGRV